MPTFLVERYSPRAGADDALDALAPGTADGGAGVRLILSVTVPDDEIALGLFEAPSRESVARVLEARRVAFIRIVDALLHAPAG